MTATVLELGVPCGTHAIPLLCSDRATFDFCAGEIPVATIEDFPVKFSVTGWTGTPSAFRIRLLAPLAEHLLNIAT